MKKNLSGQLYEFFRLYLIRKEKERLAPRTYSYPGYRCSSWMQETENEKYEGVILFYEWSDVNRAPTMFYTIPAFDAWLRRNDIFMPPFQKDIIKSLDRAHITCKKGTHDLLIRASKPMLEEALKRADAPAIGLDVIQHQKMTITPPLCLPAATGSQTRMPPMYNGHPEDWY